MQTPGLAWTCRTRTLGGAGLQVGALPRWAERRHPGYAAHASLDREGFVMDEDTQQGGLAEVAESVNERL